jgi:hypothetical protein
MQKIQLTEDQIRKALKEHRQRKEAAEALGVSTDTLRRRCQTLGIPHAKTGPKLGQNKGKNNPMWKGGQPIVKGYRWIRMPEHPNATTAGYIAEHRLVMSKLLGRPLDEGEVVHHKNRNKLDNRPENLELIGSNAEHLQAELGGCPIHALCCKLHLKRTDILQALEGGDWSQLRESDRWTNKCEALAHLAYGSILLQDPEQP